jgi:hypothetical protein
MEIYRRRLKQTESFQDRLTAFAEDARVEAAKLPPSTERDVAHAFARDVRAFHAEKDVIKAMASQRANPARRQCKRRVSPVSRCKCTAAAS